MNRPLIATVNATWRSTGETYGAFGARGLNAAGVVVAYAARRLPLPVPGRLDVRLYARVELHARAELGAQVDEIGL